MNCVKFVVFALVCSCISITLPAQKISYSEPEREDSRRTEFEIIGRVGGNILVFKNNRSNNFISVYDNEMKLVERVPLDYIDEKWINVDFIPYPEHCWMIYQYQRRGVIHCMGVKIDGKAKRLMDPIELDTTKLGWSSNNKIYSTIYSDDKRKVMVFKINSRNPENFLFTTLLFNDQMELQAKHRMNLGMDERNDYFTDFLLDNEGDLVFGKFIRKGGSDYVTDVKLISKKADREEFLIYDLRTQDRVLDEVKLKVDNSNNRYLLSSLYYKQRRGNVEGLFTITWDKSSQTIVKQHVMSFSEELRKQAKGPDANARLAFNDYFLKTIITRKDGGYILIGEAMYTTTRGGAFNRWDYLAWNSPWASPLDYYYSPFYNPWRSPWNRWGAGQATRYHAENILILSFDKDGGVEWSNVIPKTQFDDESDMLISHQILNTGGEIHFLFNLYERRTLLLNDHTLSPNGKIIRHPTLRNLDKGFEFMPRFGKQVGARSMVMPCQYRNYLTFAKIDF